MNNKLVNFLLVLFSNTFGFMDQIIIHFLKFIITIYLVNIIKANVNTLLNKLDIPLYYLMIIAPSEESWATICISDNETLV